MVKPESYLLVTDDKIISIGILEQHIINRGHPFDMYIPCYHKDKPELPRFSTYEEQITLETDYSTGKKYGVLSYMVKPYTLQAMLNHVKILILREIEDKDNISEEVISHTCSLISDYINIKLNAFAKQRQYDNIISLCSYINDPKYKTDAEVGIKLRSDTWNKYEEYCLKIKNREIEFPISINDIEEYFPKLTWGPLNE